MEDKIIEFVREFNAGLENSNYYNLLQHVNNGFTEAISLPEIYLWTDDSSYEHLKKKALSGLVIQLTELLEVASPLLGDEIDKFFAEKKKQMQEKFTYAKMKTFSIATCRWKCVISGEYNEDIMTDFMDVLKEDFEYIFEGLKLDTEW